MDQCPITISHSLLKTTDHYSRSISFSVRFPRSEDVVVNHDGMSQSVAMRYDVVDECLLVLGLCKLAVLARTKLHQELIV